MKVNTYIQYNGLQLEDKTIINNIKEFWSKQGNKIKDIKSLVLYVKPEENTVYYVINDETNGSMPLA